MRTRLFYISSALLLTFGLAGCGGTASGLKEQLGLERTPPDEFAVYKRAPLEMPPDYALRPPRPGAPRPQEENVVEQARASVIGSSSKATGGATKGESIILQKAGATQTDPTIRSTVDQEKDEAAEKDRPVVDRLLDFDDTPGNAPAKVVDPAKEAERLKANKATGKSVSEGKTPVKVQ